LVYHIPYADSVSAVKEAELPGKTGEYLMELASLVKMLD
jgi:hypothetical protein